MNSLGSKIIVGLFIALTIGIVAYAFTSQEKLDRRIHEIEQREHGMVAALKVLEIKQEERTARIEERIAALHRELTDRCSRIEKLLETK